MSRRWIAPGIAMGLAVLLLFSGSVALGLGLRIAFVLASAGPIGAVLLLAIARVVGADWEAAMAPSRWALWTAPLAPLAMLAPTGVALPAQLALWSHPAAVAARALVATAALAWAGIRLRAGAGSTFAGITLALYAFFVTPVAADWLLPSAPGHPVSAVGMMLFLIQFAAALAIAITGAEGRVRRDFALLLVAALLGLGYLAYVDYLIVWFGNLPARVPFYGARMSWAPAVALVVGLGGGITGAALRREMAGSIAALVAVAIFLIWWVGGGVLAALVALVGAAAVAAMAREARHG